jgi:hypothetical protein
VCVRAYVWCVGGWGRGGAGGEVTTKVGNFGQIWLYGLSQNI